MEKFDKQLHDPIAAERVFNRLRRSKELEAALHEGMRRESFGADPRWYVLRVRQRAEKRVAEAVEKLGLTTWVPMTKAMVQRFRKRGLVKVDRPVFEGFLFVRLTGNNYAWLMLMGVDGVQSILGGEDGPLPVRPENMNALMKMQEAGVFDLAKGARAQAKALIASDFPIGSTVLIKDGPFALFEAVIDGYVHTRHVRALTNIFGGEVVVELEIDQIRRLT